MAPEAGGPAHPNALRRARASGPYMAPKPGIGVWCANIASDSDSLLDTWEGFSPGDVL